MHPKPASGYAYALYEGGWRRAPDDDWELVLITPDNSYRWLGRRHIDGSEVNVWGHRGKFYAQSTVLTGRQLLENQGGATPWVVGALALAAGIWWLTSSSESKAATPVPQKCPITESMLAPFVKQKQYVLYRPKDETRPVSNWGKPDATYLSNPKSRSFSSADCAFYKWNGTNWVVDDATNMEFDKYLNANTVKGHPADMFMVT